MRNAKICTAIRDKAILEFTYDGYQRVVEPHCHGLTRENNPGLRGYQIGGGSVSGEVPGWKMFDLNKASIIQITDRNFDGPRPGYSKGDQHLNPIYCEL